MFTEEIHNKLTEALEPHGYTVEPFDSKCSDVVDIWPRQKSKGFIEVTACHVEANYIVLCPVDYDGDDGLCEILNMDIRELVRQLNAFYKPAAAAASPVA